MSEATRPAISMLPPLRLAALNPLVVCRFYPLQMRTWDGWTHTESETAKWLQEAHRSRQKHGRAGNDVIRARMADARAAQDETRADLISLQLWKKSIAFTRIQRLRQLTEQERDLRRVGAASRRRTRELERVKNSPTAPMFEFEPARTGTKLRDARDLYWEWIPRGFSKGKPKDFTKQTKPRIRAREAKWEDGEFEDKIVYIERPDALEEVAGNLISNMGADQAERLGCASRIEELERLSRSNAGVYTHCILAMPADLSPEGRAAALKEICAHYERLKLPYSAALHKPDAKNSQRNFHAHILVGLRPMERVQDRWEFASTKLTWLSTTAGLKLQRRVIAGVFNAALEAEKSKTTFTSRSRAADGLAPGGFTKRGGVRRMANMDSDVSDVSDVLHAREDLSEAEELDEAIGALLRTAEQLENREQRLDELQAAARASSQTPASELPVPSSEFGSPADAADAHASNSDVGPPVASSQRDLRATDVEQGRDREHEAAGVDADLEVPEDLNLQDSQSLQRPYVPFPRAPHEWTVRRRKLKRVRSAAAAEPEWQDFDDFARQNLERDLDEVVRSLANGTVVLSGHGQMLRISSASYDALTAFENVANSQPGWNVLAQMGESIAELAPEHHKAFEMHSIMPADQSINMTGVDRSPGR